MLNLVIAIISDSFDRVIDEKEESDGLELNELVLEAEYMQPSNKNKKEHAFLHWIEYKSGSDFGWTGKT
jgi:hypothetical protein